MVAVLVVTLVRHDQTPGILPHESEVDAGRIIELSRVLEQL